MSFSDRLARLRLVVFGSLIAVGTLGVFLAQINGIDLNTPIVRRTFYCFLGTLSLSVLLLVIDVYGLRESAPERTRRRYRFAADLLALMSIRHLFTLAITFASYGLVPHGLALADEWLSWPERMLGITHPVVYRTCEAWGLLVPMEFVYDTVWVQVMLILGWFGLVRRNLLPLWEVAAAVSLSATVGLVVFWLAPAVGPWAYYGQAAYGSSPPPAEAAFLADFLALREGRLTALLAGQGLVTIPSFHVVFAVLFTWVFRRERFLYPIAIVLNLAVIAVTFPVGWHYLADLPAGMIWVAVTIAVVRRIQGTPAQSAAAQEPALSPLQGVLREGGSS
jgi:PAP2 superfamily protein